MTITTTENTTTGAFDESDAKVLDYLGLNPNNPASRAVILVCRAYDLDAVLKHVIVIPKGGVYITRDGLLHIAHRSGQLDGIVVEQEPAIVDGEWVAKVSVYRKDMTHPFTFPGRYPVNGSNKQYAPEMALKAAESHALRRAFAVTGLPTEDEWRPETPRTGGGLGAALERETGEAMTDKTRREMFALFSERQIPDDRQLEGINQMLGTTHESRGDLTEAQAREVIAALRAMEAPEPDGADEHAQMVADQLAADGGEG